MPGLRRVFSSCLEVYHSLEFVDEPRAMQYRADFEHLIDLAGQKFSKPARDLPLFKRVYLDGVPARKACRQFLIPQRTGVSHFSKNISLVSFLLIGNKLFPPRGYFEEGVRTIASRKYETIKVERK